MTTSINRRHRVAATGLTALLTVALAACGGKQDQDDAAGGTAAETCVASPGQMTIATGNSTGVYYALGGGIANLISSNTKIKATASETGASVQNIQQLQAGKYDIAFSLADTAADAVSGKGAFAGKPADVKSLGRLYSNYTHVVVSKKSGIKTMADFKGKTISTGSPKSGTEVIANRLLKSAGLDPAKDVKAQRLELGKTVEGMKDGTIDGLVWSGGLPTGGITDLVTAMKDEVVFLDVTPLLPKMKAINPVYATAPIPESAYGVAPSQAIVVPNFLLVRSNFKENDACHITKLIFSKKDDLAKVHVAAEALDVKTARNSAPVKLHPGSEKGLVAAGG